MKRIPLIKFPLRHPKSSTSSSGIESQTKATAGSVSANKVSTSKSDVPSPPSSSGGGGKASLQPKRTPLSDKEIEAVLLGGSV
ncbi:hypothetical protein RND81_14G101600 [Saponaria officinalis]|uniref:Uncharacterized protein n=1 Tax=Saponaria officinalis TaxID=3572 RepID=A0AAW1GKP1_SAPOF